MVQQLGGPEAAYGAVKTEVELRWQQLRATYPGVGLLSAAWDADKVYAHYWDEAVGQCTRAEAPLQLDVKCTSSPPLASRTQPPGPVASGELGKRSTSGRSP